MARRGIGRNADTGISSSPTSERSSEPIVTGSFLLAAVLGLRSWEGDGWRFSEAACNVEAISKGAFEAMINGWK